MAKGHGRPALKSRARSSEHSTSLEKHEIRVGNDVAQRRIDCIN